MSGNSTLHHQDDVIFAERREETRNIEGMEGRYQLKNWRDANGAPRDFPCRIKKMSSGLIEIVGPVTGSTGEWAIAIFDSLGRFEGPVIRAVPRGFAMRIVTTVDDRKNIDGKIAWVGNKGPEKRRHERLIPSDPHSTLYMPDGRAVPCRIVDYSMSGAALAAESHPELGTMLIVGRIIGRVTRQFAEGFAVEFLTLRDHRNIADLFAKREDAAP